MGVILRLVFFGMVIWFIYRYLQQQVAGRSGNQTSEPPPFSGQAMRRCAYCQVHVPEGESTQSRGEFFCSEAHRDAFFRERR